MNGDIATWKPFEYNPPHSAVQGARDSKLHAQASLLFDVCFCLFLERREEGWCLCVFIVLLLHKL